MALLASFVGRRPYPGVERSVLERLDAGARVSDGPIFRRDAQYSAAVQSCARSTRQS